MERIKNNLIILSIILLGNIMIVLSSCDSGGKIISVEVYQLPYKIIYVAGMTDSLDMYGCIIRIDTRREGAFYDLFEDAYFATVRHEIDFSIPGEYEVLFYWSESQIYSMIIHVIPASD